jgi:hypothetical protein
VSSIQISHSSRGDKFGGQTWYGRVDLEPLRDVGTRWLVVRRRKSPLPGGIWLYSGGGGIRTLEGPGRPLAVFKTAAFDRSATPPVPDDDAMGVSHDRLHWPNGVERPAPAPPRGEVAEWLKALAC